MIFLKKELKDINLELVPIIELQISIFFLDFFYNNTNFISLIEKITLKVGNIQNDINQ